MEQEHKELLLKDLCARLPYGVVVEHCSGIRGTLHDLFVHWCYDENDVMHGREAFTSTFFGDADCDISKFKPYLFPLSSMTEKQKEELLEITDAIKIDDIGIYYEEGDTLETYLSKIPYTFMCNVVTWCYKNHLDINNLIPLNLAIDATGLNIY